MLHIQAAGLPLQDDFQLSWSW